jgi:hypothetical protein
MEKFSVPLKILPMSSIPKGVQFDRQPIKFLRQRIPALP